jgi:peroxiredoxin
MINMKKIILLMLAAVPAVAFAQEKYIIQGKVGTLNAPATAYLSYRTDGKFNTDSTLIINGAFRFSGQVDDITQARVAVDHKIANADPKARKDVMTVYLVNGTTVVASADSLINAKITGTRVNIDAQNYSQFLTPVSKANSALYTEYYAASKEKRASKEFGDYMDKKEDSIANVEKKLDSLYIASNPGSYMSLQALKGMGGPYPDPAYLQPKFSSLSPAIQNSKSGVAYQKYLDILKAVAVGQTAPDFAEADTSGKLVRLSSFRGKYVLLDFWASWCGPCRAENPNVVKAYNNFKGKNFTILSVSLDRPGKRDAWIKAIKTDGLAWNHVSDLKFWDADAVKLYGIQAIPQNLLLDPDGKIIGKDLFGDDLEKKLAEIFGKI